MPAFSKHHSASFSSEGTFCLFLRDFRSGISYALKQGIAIHTLSCSCFYKTPYAAQITAWHRATSTTCRSTDGQTKRQPLTLLRFLSRAGGPQGLLPKGYWHQGRGVHSEGAHSRGLPNAACSWAWLRFTARVGWRMRAAPALAEHGLLQVPMDGTPDRKSVV